MAKNNQPDMDEAYRQLQVIVKQFEQGNISLEESIVQFEKGLGLAKQLKDRLKVLENKIVEIKVKFQDPDQENNSHSPDATDIPF